jgi:hypothetical protein
MYGGAPQGPKHVKASEKFRNCVLELPPGRWKCPGPGHLAAGAPVQGAFSGPRSRAPPLPLPSRVPKRLPGPRAGQGGVGCPGPGHLPRHGASLSCLASTIGQAAQRPPPPPQKNTDLPLAGPDQARGLRLSPSRSTAGRRDPRRRRTQHPSCYLRASSPPPTAARPTGV